MGLLPAPGHRPRTATHDPATRGPPARPGAGPALHQPDVPAALDAAGRGGADDRPADRGQPPPHPPTPRPRPPHRLSAGALPRPLVRFDARVRTRPVPARPPGPRRPRPPGRG